MPPPLKITSTANDRVKAVAKLLREKRQRDRSGLFVAEGVREVTRAAAAGLRLWELWLCPQMLRAGEQELKGLHAADAARIEVMAPVMAKIAYRGDEAEGVLAVFEQPQWRLEDLGGSEGLWLIAAGISKPGNLGAMARSAQAAGASGLIVANGVVDAFNPNAIWASTGAVFTLPVVGAEKEAVFRWLREKHIRLYAAVLGGEERHDKVDWQGSVAAAIGAEDVGLDSAWVEAAKATGGCGIRIDMAGGLVDSLNASVAAGIILFEARRQRRR